MTTLDRCLIARFVRTLGVVALLVHSFAALLLMLSLVVRAPHLGAPALATSVLDGVLAFASVTVTFSVAVAAAVHVWALQRDGSLVAAAVSGRRPSRSHVPVLMLCALLGAVAWGVEAHVAPKARRALDRTTRGVGASPARLARALAGGGLRFGNASMECSEDAAGGLAHPTLTSTSDTGSATVLAAESGRIEHDVGARAVRLTLDDGRLLRTTSGGDVAGNHRFERLVLSHDDGLLGAVDLDRVPDLAFLTDSETRGLRDQLNRTMRVGIGPSRSQRLRARRAGNARSSRLAGGLLVPLGALIVLVIAGGAGPRSCSRAALLGTAVVVVAALPLHLSTSSAARDGVLAHASLAFAGPALALLVCASAGAVGRSR